MERREFFIKAAKATVATAGAAALTKRELDVIYEGTSTPSGIFFPLYENHDIGIKAKDIPSELDAIFVEMMFDASGFNELASYKSFYISQAFQDQDNTIIQKLAKNRTRIMFGDILVPLEEDLQNRQYEGIGSVIMVGVDAILPEKINNKPIPRRKLISRALWGGSFMGSFFFFDDCYFFNLLPSRRTGSN